MEAFLLEAIFLEAFLLEAFFLEAFFLVGLFLDTPSLVYAVLNLTMYQITFLPPGAQLLWILVSLHMQVGPRKDMFMFVSITQPPSLPPTQILYSPESQKLDNPSCYGPFG